MDDSMHSSVCSACKHLNNAEERDAVIQEAVEIMEGFIVLGNRDSPKLSLLEARAFVATHKAEPEMPWSFHTRDQGGYILSREGGISHLEAGRIVGLLNANEPFKGVDKAKPKPKWELVPAPAHMLGFTHIVCKERDVGVYVGVDDAAEHCALLNRLDPPKETP